MNILQQQYSLVKSSRAVMLSFIKDGVGDDFVTPVVAFNDKSIIYLLTHVADVYKHWLANFGMAMFLPYTDERTVTGMDEVMALYAETDDLTNSFIMRFNADIDELITGKIVSGKIVTATALTVFTHVITHEFHHKGQIMSMCRLLGHVPPDTDIIRT